MPQEMFGGAEFPAIGTTPYFLSMGPYASYWFILQAPEPVIMWTEVTPGALEELEATLPVLVLSGRWDSLFAPGVRRRLETDLLPAYLLHQRWFGGKARTIERVRLLDYGVLQAAADPQIKPHADVDGIFPVHVVTFLVSDHFQGQFVVVA